jgi:deazaflavin-dependent oxidoreductase (nitroreductase family)
MSSSNSREDFLNELKRSSEVRITVTGRKTMKKFSTPVWFILDGRKVILVPTMGSDNNWFKDLVKDPRIELSVGKNTIASEATIVRDSDQAENVIGKLRAKYRSMWSDSYYTKRDVCVEVSM